MKLPFTPIPNTGSCISNKTIRKITKALRKDKHTPYPLSLLPEPDRARPLSSSRSLASGGRCFSSGGGGGPGGAAAGGRLGQVAAQGRAGASARGRPARGSPGSATAGARGRPARGSPGSAARPGYGQGRQACAHGVGVQSHGVGAQVRNFDL